MPAPVVEVLMNYSNDVINFVMCLTFGAELTLISLEDAAYDIQEWKLEEIEIPEGLTPEAYMEIWNSVCADG